MVGVPTVAVEIQNLALVFVFHVRTPYPFGFFSVPLPAEHPSRRTSPSDQNMAKHTGSGQFMPQYWESKYTLIPCYSPTNPQGPSQTRINVQTPVCPIMSNHRQGNVLGGDMYKLKVTMLQCSHTSWYDFGGQNLCILTRSWSSILSFLISFSIMNLIPLARFCNKKLSIHFIMIFL